MKRIVFFICILIACSRAHAQLTITPSQSATQLANLLVATAGNLGVTVTNAVLTCDSLGIGEVTGNSNFGINNGIVLSSGYVNTDIANNIVGLNKSAYNLSSQNIGSPGDLMLNNIATPYQTFDACVLEFDIQPVGTFMEFEYVFGSEEYPEYNCTPYNDVFAFYISGPGIPAPTNIALIPNTAIPVSITSINDGTGGACSIYQNYYVQNTDTTNVMDGFTTPLIAHVNVTPGQTYHLKFAIADVSDQIYNSFVILKANSLKSGNSPSSLVSTVQHSGLEIYPTKVESSFFINNPEQKTWNIDITSLDGNKVYQAHINKNQQKSSFDISSLSKGIYILKMNRKEDNKIFFEKIIKL